MFLQKAAARKCTARRPRLLIRLGEVNEFFSGLAADDALVGGHVALVEGHVARGGVVKFLDLVLALAAAAPRGLDKAVLHALFQFFQRGSGVDVGVAEGARLRQAGFSGKTIMEEES